MEGELSVSLSTSTSSSSSTTDTSSPLRLCEKIFSFPSLAGKYFALTDGLLCHLLQFGGRREDVGQLGRGAPEAS